jgi:hypothetical protein
MTGTRVPDDLATVVRTAASAAPTSPGDLATVRRRGRAHRRHRVAATTGLTSLAVAAVLGTPNRRGCRCGWPS